MNPPHMCWPSIVIETKWGTAAESAIPPETRSSSFIGVPKSQKYLADSFAIEKKFI